jgi:hypothetical protein
MDQNDCRGVREVDIAQIFQDVSIIHCGVVIRDFDMVPTFERSKHHEEVGGPVAPVLVIETGRASRFHRDRHIIGLLDPSPELCFQTVVSAIPMEQVK